MADDLKLLPCPMCGSADVHFSSPGLDDDEHSFDFVICNGCGISAGRADCEGNLHDVWNRRAPSSPVADDGLQGAAQTSAESAETRMDASSQQLFAIADDWLPKPWRDRMMDYYGADESKLMHGTGYFKDAEIDEWRAWAARRAAPQPPKENR